MEFKSHEMAISLMARIGRKANSLIIRELKRNDIKGLETSHGDIIGMLFVRDTLSMNELASLIHKDKSTVTALVGKLVEQGYVKKEKSDVDSRVTYIALTAKSKDLWPVLMGISEKLLETAYKGFSDQEKDDLIRLLKKLDSNL